MGREKAASNLRKHGVSFEEASSVFLDPLAGSDADPDHALEEARYVTMGTAHSGQILVVAHTCRAGHIRLISARPATRLERKLYEES